MNHTAYHFKVTPPQPGAEILMALIADMGFESFTESPDGFTAYISEDLEGSVELSSLKFEDFTFEVRKEKIVKQNWNEEWEKNFSPVEVDDLLLIRAPFHPSSKKHGREIIIMPKMSFGTGHHQTTRLMCHQILSLDLQNKRVLDMGCGTGILAILAKQCGAGEVLAIDIDEWSVENSKENFEANACKGIQVLKGDIDSIRDERPFDVIVANINKNVLKSHLPHYSKKLNKEGVLLLSGFFVTDVEELKICAVEAGLSYAESKTIGEWAMMELKMNN